MMSGDCCPLRRAQVQAVAATSQQITATCSITIQPIVTIDRSARCSATAYTTNSEIDSTEPTTSVESRLRSDEVLRHKGGREVDGGKGQHEADDRELASERHDRPLTARRRRAPP